MLTGALHNVSVRQNPGEQAREANLTRELQLIGWQRFIRFGRVRGL